MNAPADLIEEAYEALLDAEFDIDADPFASNRGIAECEARIDEDLSRARGAASRAAMAMADQLTAIADTLCDAHEAPEVFVGPLAKPGAENLEFARRAAISELAVTLGITETTVAAYANTANVLRGRLPAIWGMLELGQTSYQKALIIADCASSLPDDPDTLAVFDETMSEAAPKLTPTKLRLKARAMREKLHPQSPVARHKTAMDERRLWLDPAPDGMAWLGAFVSADAAYRAEARIDVNARHLCALPDETRTLAQLRADVFADIFTGDGTAHEVKVTVSATVPVLTMAGVDTPEDYRSNPAILNGYGPIDPETARRLCARAPSLFRLLTDPIDGAILTVDRKSYRPPADLKRLVKALLPTCSFPGCNRSAEGCDIDHSLNWGFDGRTKLHNLAPLCRHHHRIKHNTLWTMQRAKNTGKITWTSPTGVTHDTDPPPF